MVYGATYTFDGVAVFLMYPLFQWMKSAGSFDPVSSIMGSRSGKRPHLNTILCRNILIKRICFSFISKLIKGII